MATEKSIEHADKEHSSTYSLFKVMVKWGTVATAIVTFIVVLIIAS